MTIPYIDINDCHSYHLRWWYHECIPGPTVNEGHISIIVCMQYAYKFNSGEFSMVGKAYHRDFKLQMLKAISSCIKILYEICIT